MKKLIILALLLLSLGASAQQSLDSAYIRENYVKIERMIPMRDGVKLFTAIYLPKDKTEKHPILMTRTPYSCAPYGETNYRPYWNTYHRLYFRENYIIVQQDVRGRFMSEGVFEDVRPFNGAKKTNQDIDEASDTYDTIDWLLKNLENNNGKVGAFGISYPGFYATMAAISGHPALVAVFWQARNARNNVAGIKPAILVVGGLYDAEDCYGAWRLYEAIEQKNPVTQFNKIVMGPWYHGQWASNEGGTRLGNATFKQRTSDWYQNNIEVPFFNYHLKGKGNIASLPEATVFMTGKNEWKQYDVWPPAEAKEQSLYFQPGKGLAWTKPTTASAPSTYISDPSRPVPYADGIHMGRTREYMTDDQRFASRRPDVLTFETPVLTEDLTVTGTVIADLKVTLSTTDADFVVKIIDVYPDDHKDSELRYPMGGAQMLVRGEIMRGKFRNSFEKPEPFKPGKVETVKFELPDISHCFKKGHKLMIQVQSSWFPLADRNPQQFMNIYQAEDKDFVPSTIQLHHDAKNSSAIILPVLGGR